MAALPVGETCALKACGNCKVRKKKCDKIFPSCTTCQKWDISFNLHLKHTDNNRKFISCNYEENRSQHEIRTLRLQLEYLSNGINIPSEPSPIQLTLDSTTQYYPVPSQWYMPFLVNHCKSVLTSIALRHMSNSPFH
jgi:hypothetical protein